MTHDRTDISSFSSTQAAGAASTRHGSMNEPLRVGVEALSFATGSYVLDLKELALDLGVDPEKYRTGLGQEFMSVPAPDEDIVTMGAEAAAPLVAQYAGKIRTLLFATETGIDHSKSAGVYVHRLLGMASHCRVVELKQACYGTTAALQLAASYVKDHPDEKVLVIAADIARYEARSNAEPTQGCGAVAFILGTEPKLFTIDRPYGVFTEDVMDFWRPNYRETALVDGKFSAKIYLQALKACWKDLQERFGLAMSDFQQFCYHLPFTRMAVKAHLQMQKEEVSEEVENREKKRLEPSLIYSRQVGNCYSASAYLGILSLLENSQEDLADQKMAIYSFGSGSVGELFTATIVKGYRSYLDINHHMHALKRRLPVDVKKYRDFLYSYLPKDGSRFELPKTTLGKYRLCAIDEHKRIYETCF